MNAQDVIDYFNEHYPDKNQKIDYIEIVGEDFDKSREQWKKIKR